MVARTESVIRSGRGTALCVLALVAGLCVPAVRADSDPPPPIVEADDTSNRSAGLGGEVTVIAQTEYFEDSNDNTYLDPSVFVGWKQMHAQVWAGEFTKGAQLGGFLRDGRRSTYGAFYRYRQDADHVVDLSTEQLLGKGFVGYAGVRYIQVIDAKADDTLWQPSVGFDKYYGGYSFFSFRAIHDPRESGRYSFVLANRLGLANKYLTLGVAPRTDGEVGWFVQTQWRWLRAGYGRFNQFDFTDLDREAFNIGLQFGF